MGSNCFQALTANWARESVMHLHFDYQFGESGFGVYGGVGAGFSRNTLNLTVSGDEGVLKQLL